MEPKTPQTLEELVVDSDKIRIITFSDGYVDSKAELGAGSILLDVGIPDILAEEGITREKQEMFTRLRNMTHLILLTFFHGAWPVSNSGFFRNSNGTEVVVKSGIFAVVGSSGLKQFHHALTLLGKYKAAKAHILQSFYATKEFFCIQKNIFTDILAMGWASLVESGIYRVWKTNYFIAKPQMEAYLGFRKVKRESNAAIGGSGAADFEATTLEQVTIPFVLYLSMMLTSGAIFLIEFKLKVSLWDRVTRF